MMKEDMADEDEIDVLGDFNLDTLLSKNENEMYGSFWSLRVIKDTKCLFCCSSSCCDNSLLPNSSELLGCDYGLNSTWLIDHGVASGTDIWYSNSATDFSSEDSPANTSLGFDEVICSEKKITDEIGWTEDEKNLLERGLVSTCYKIWSVLKDIDLFTLGNFWKKSSTIIRIHCFQISFANKALSK